MNEMENFVNSDDEFPVGLIQDGIQALKQIANPVWKMLPQTFSVSFYEFYFLAALELSKMY